MTNLGDLITAFDPGMKGGIAAVPAEGELDLVALHDMPVRRAGRSRATRSSRAHNEVDEDALANILEEMDQIAGIRLGVVEMPAKVGGFSRRKDGRRVQESGEMNLRQGMNVSVIRGALAMLRVRRLYPPARVWTARLGVGPSERDRCEMAARLFPRHAKLFYGPDGGCKDGRADAALLCYYGRLILGKV